jgi:hypothetical protein
MPFNRWGRMFYIREIAHTFSAETEPEETSSRGSPYRSESLITRR